MRKLNSFVIWLAPALLVALLTVTARADDKPAATTADTADKPAEPAGTLLFDGETLKNWKPTDFGREGKVEVKDGLLIIGKGEPLTGVTWDGEELPPRGL